jgi:polysaccharide chain length determinant protein (PEP-CTERM system associated)
VTELLNKILNEVRGAWRFRLYALLTAWVVCLIGWTAISLKPDLYRSTARVFVDPRTPLSPVLSGLTIHQDVQAQFNLVRQSLWSRPVLERIAEQAGLFERAENSDRMKVLAQLAGNMKLVSSDPGGGGLMVAVHYSDPDRETSLRVTQMIVDTLIGDTLGGKEQGSEVARRFLHEQIQDYEQRLREAEEKLADFKKQYVGLMPGAQGDYFSRLQAQMAQVEKTQAELSVAMKRREELNRQLQGEGNLSVAAELSIQKSPTSERLRQAQARLDELSLQYTEKHPDIVALRETIEQLKERQAQELEVLRQGQAVLASSGAGNPVIQSIQLALNEVDVEIAALRARIADEQQAVADLRRLVNTAPEVEAEFMRLNRDYDVTRKQYTALIERAERARLGDEAEQTQSVRFEVIDPPRATFEPVSPNRPKLMAAVLVAGLGAGAGLAYLLQLLRPVFSSSRTLAEVTGLPVLGIVSRTWIEKHRRAMRLVYLRYGIATAALLVVFGVFLKFSDEGARFAQALIG